MKARGKKISKTDMENNSSASSVRSNNFFSGFLLGVLVGAAVVFLFGTKKGKKLLKAISEEGEGKISNILEKIEDTVDLEEETLEVSEDDRIKTAIPKKEIIKKVVVQEKPKTARRFFRGISRHLN